MNISGLIWTTVLVTCLHMIIRMSRKNYLIQILIVKKNNHPAMTALVHLEQGNPYALDHLWQIKKRVKHDKTLWIISPQTVNTIRKIRIQKRRKQRKKGGVKVHQAIRPG